MAARPRPKPHDLAALVREAEAALDAGDAAKACAVAEVLVQASDASAESRGGVGATGLTRASTRRLFAEALLESDRAEDAQRAAEEGLRIAHAARDRGEEALAEIAVAQAASTRGDCVRALRHAARARSLALRGGESQTLRSALAENAALLSRMGDSLRADELIAQALALAPGEQTPRRALRVFALAATVHRAAGRFERAIATLDEADALAKRAKVEPGWALTAARALTYVDVGAFDPARALLATRGAAEAAETAPRWRRAELLSLRAAVAHAAGERPEVVEKLACEGLAIDGLELPVRNALERLRALALLARGRADEAERIAVGLASVAAQGGRHAFGAHAFALAARSGHPDAWLLRWLGCYGLAARGVAARVEHEALAALSGEPDPIGAFARTLLAVARDRLLEQAPQSFRGGLTRALRQVEAKLTAQRRAGRAQLEMALDDETLRAKEEVGLVGSSVSLLRAIATLARAAKSDASLVITGETGSGKELFARLAHTLSERAEGPFVALNCAAIPQALLEAELFGHERGAFTGADRARDGMFVEAEGGTLLLDELGEMSPAMQSKLLRVLEDRTVRPVGGSRARKVDVRVVAATHRDLASMVASGAFREDLYYRIAAITVRVPSLRERPEDIPTIARALLARDPATPNHRLDVPALTALAEHTWPGNVRELSNALRVAAAMVEGSVIGRDELAEAIGGGVRATPAKHAERLEETTLAALRARHRAELRELVGRAIAGADGNKRKAAHSLGVSRQGLYRVLED